MNITILIFILIDLVFTWTVGYVLESKLDRILRELKKVSWKYVPGRR